MKKKTTKTIDLKDVKKQQPKKYISKKRIFIKPYYKYFNEW